MTLADYERELKHLIRLGRPFGEIEERIERTPLSEEQRSALWLCAWAFAELAAERRAKHAAPARR